ncbi:hypothetical protein BU14_0058s0088 [Porphyra umbilicalis]|uniref:Uncharacterized protein n=1 Tax=Porphyra umbilicalis TaxID=2786 RepID=A0A1X6PH36_PORUM|nr:hypothetical protein BU14_0058s0088 [Porphyra umbilicalis]|eukprot:OSX80177.1 hypothetical protein BU14_0058s0088 [Porphyra umbilicalis]
MPSMACRPARNPGTSPSRARHPASSPSWRRPQSPSAPRAVASAATVVLEITTSRSRTISAASPSATATCSAPTPPPNTQKPAPPFMSALRTMSRGPPSAQVPARMISTPREAARAASTDRTKTAWGHATGPQTARARRKVGAPAPQTDAKSNKSRDSPSERGGDGGKNERESGGSGEEADGDAGGGRRGGAVTPTSATYGGEGRGSWGTAGVVAVTVGARGEGSRAALKRESSS